jgi:hypothetical protein
MWRDGHIVKQCWTHRLTSPVSIAESPADPEVCSITDSGSRRAVPNRSAERLAAKPRTRVETFWRRAASAA